MKIAVLSHYPASAPRHGGQRRLAAMLHELERAGHEVLTLPLFLARSYPQATPAERETALPAAAVARLEAGNLREDLHLARVLAPETEFLAQVLARLRAFAPDVVQFEQPWLHPLFAAALAPGGALAPARLVYSSQNVESALIDPAWQAEAEALERALTGRADLVVAVSAQDGAVLAGWRGAAGAQGGPAQDGAAQGGVVVAPNGCWPPPEGPPPPREIAGDYALVTGSAHPPNAEGYWRFIGRIPGFLPPESCLVVAGGMNDLLRADPRFGQFRRLNDEFVRNLGSIEEERLTGLLWHARVIALPVLRGGGTNLKTAEALIWRRPVVASRAALRGHDGAEALAGVAVADTPAGFRHLLRAAMVAGPGPMRSRQEVAHLGWPACLAPWLAALERLARTAGAEAGMAKPGAIRAGVADE